MASEGWCPLSFRFSVVGVYSSPGILNYSIILVIMHGILQYCTIGTWY